MSATTDGELRVEHAVDTGASLARATPAAARLGVGRAARAPGLRLYALVALDAAHDAAHDDRRGLAAETELVRFRDVAAVVEPGPYVADALLPQELERHQQVVESAFAQRTVVPAPPGTVFRSAETLAGWLELHYYTLLEALHFVDERAVARVTVRRGRPGALDGMDGGADATLAARGAALAETREMSLRLAPPLTGEHPAVLADDDALALAAEPFRALRREAAAMLVLRADDASAARAAYGSFLIERSRWPAFEQAVRREGQQRPGLQLALSGPWPPYDFVRLQFHG